MNSITLNNYEDWNSDDIKVSCKTTIGNQYKGEVKQYKSITEMYSLFELGDTTNEVSETEVLFTKADDPKKYSTYSDDTHTYTNCTIEMVVSELALNIVGDNFFEYVYEIE